MKLVYKMVCFYCEIYYGLEMIMDLMFIVGLLDGIEWFVGGFVYLVRGLGFDWW